jgi:putative ABC transport system ATP-binding protein
MDCIQSPVIQITGLRRSFREGEREHIVLDGIDLEMLKGEAVALRGRSGTGKSTLLNLVSGIDAPDNGRIVVAGVEITALTERDRTLFRRRHMGFVYQAFNLVPTLSVFDNVRLVLELNGLPPRKAAGKVEEVLRAVELADRAESFPDVLSGGEQQRVAIARALCHGPEVLLADEPTGNLDTATGHEIMQILDGLHAEGNTVVLVTHEPYIAEHASRRIYLRDGRIESEQSAAASR